MDNPLPPPPPGATNPETLIAACTALLSRRRFSTCRDFAIRLHPYLPSSADQILAIADVLSSADRRDWYSALRLRPSNLSTSLDLARNHFRNLALLLDPSSNSFPLSSEAFTCLRQAWHVLSDPQRRHLYDLEIEGQYPNTTTPPPPQPMQHVRGTFWTACPYCWNLYEYEEEYEDCALRCEGCQKVFHGLAVTPPVREETVEVEGQRREYYSCHASVPLRYFEVSEMKNEYEEEDNKKMGEPGFVYISDDDDVFGGSLSNVVQGNMKNDNNGRVELQGDNNGKRTMRVKTVAKKVGGNRRMRRQQGLCAVDDDDGDLDLDVDLDLDADDGNGGGGGGGGGELEFTEGDNGDIFVGMRFGD